MVYITGDKHGDFKTIARFCSIMGTKYSDTMIILGDSGFNYYIDKRNIRYRKSVENIPITFFCIHGNHEERAELLPMYHEEEYWGGKVLVEDAYPNIKFAIDGEVYNIPTSRGIKKAIVIGGAYSVDKFWRISIGANWYASEQPTDEIKRKVEFALARNGGKVDLVLSHTCPYSYMPREWFIGGVDQSTVDNSTEQWLDFILNSLVYYEKWYCGHFHGDKSTDKLTFMYNKIELL